MWYRTILLAFLVLVQLTLPMLAAQNSDGLIVRLSAATPTVRSVDDVKLTAVIVNNSDSKAIINNFVLNLPKLSLELLDAKGRRVLPGPPPMPPKEMEQYSQILQPHAQKTIHYDLAGMFQIPVPNGTYTLRMHRMKSNDVKIFIKQR
jgi:hypothetical protein